MGETLDTATVARTAPSVGRHAPSLPLRIGTRASPLALVQTRAFLARVTRFCPVLQGLNVFQEFAIRTEGDRSQASGIRLADVGGKGLFAKELHEAMLDGRIDMAVHSLKDLETELPAGIVLACTLAREDARDVLILGPAADTSDAAGLPFPELPLGALVGSSSVRRQAQLLHARPDLVVQVIRGNVHSRLDKVRRGDFAASLLAFAGLRRLGLEDEADVLIDPAVMVPAACQGIVRHHRARAGHRTAPPAGRDQRRRRGLRRRRRTRAARRARRLLPYADRRPCDAAARGADAPRRPGRPGGRQLPAPPQLSSASALTAPAPAPRWATSCARTAPATCSDDEKFTLEAFSQRTTARPAAHIR